MQQDMADAWPLAGKLGHLCQTLSKCLEPEPLYALCCRQLRFSAIIALGVLTAAVVRRLGFLSRLSGLGLAPPFPLSGWHLDVLITSLTSLGQLDDSAFPLSFGESLIL